MNKLTTNIRVLWNKTNNKPKQKDKIVMSDENKSQLPMVPKDMFADKAALGGFEKISMPPFVRPEEFPIGGVLIGRVKEVIGNFTSDPELDETNNLVLVTAKGECLMPITGVIGQALSRIVPKNDKKEPQFSAIVGKEIAIKRLEDSTSKRFKGNKMFMFDVFVKK